MLFNNDKKRFYKPRPEGFEAMMKDNVDGEMAKALRQARDIAHGGVKPERSKKRFMVA